MSYMTAVVVDPAKTSRTGSDRAGDPYTAAVEGSPPLLPVCPQRALGGIPMDCLKCKNLEQAFESRLSEYIEARSAAYYRVSTELAAYKNVDMERARNDMEEHQLVCVSAAEVRRREPMIGRWSSCPPFSA